MPPGMGAAAAPTLPGRVNPLPAAAGIASKLSPCQLLWACCLLQLVSAYIFCTGFLLARLELPDRSSCDAPSAVGSCPCSGPPPFKKAVIVVIDALRADFYASEGCSETGGGGRSPPAHAEQMPRLTRLVTDAGAAAAVARFVADTPTVTPSRLKALLTGGIPTFLDVREAFSAQHIVEDSWATQAAARGARLVVAGDDTWGQLLPSSVWSQSHLLPSLVVHDLHSVDDGVWRTLQALLRAPDTWDVAVAHYLGADHTGHTHGAGSAQMAAKLAQLDGQVDEVARRMIAEAGPGGEAGWLAGCMCSQARVCRPGPKTKGAARRAGWGGRFQPEIRQKPKRSR